MQFSNVTRGFGLTLAVALLGAAAAHAADPYASAPPYARPLVPGIVLQPLVTTGQKIALTGGAPADSFRFVGIPDGLGAFGANGQLTLLAHHEFTLTSGGAAGPMPSGARISNLQLSYENRGTCASASVLSGKYEIVNVYKGEPPVLQAPGTPRFTRFCSAFLADQKVGFDRPVFMSGEESGGAATFDGQGASSFATYNGDTYHLPRLGHFNWENQVVLPGTGAQTVVIGLEDAGTLTSQLYVYVGTKQPAAADWLSKNGLNNGQSYVFTYNDPLHKDENTFTAKGTSTTGSWAQINYLLTDVQLEAQVQGLGSFNFIRIEDGASDPRTTGVFYFATTGSPATADPFGRLYKLTFDPANILAGATLTIVLDGSEGIVSPDNIDINRHGQMMLCEDPNYNLSAPPLNLTRDTYLWSFNIDTPAVNPTPVAEMDFNAARTHALTIPGNSALSYAPGDQEFSGVLDAEEWMGPGTWLFDIQAHRIRIAPTAETVEGGQILLLRNECPIPVEQSLFLQGESIDNGFRLSWNLSDPDARLDGYRVTRAASAQGPWTNVTEGLLISTVHRFDDAPGAGTWLYRVEALSRGVTVASAGPVRAEVGGTLPVLARLEAPTPNPSKGNTVLSFSIPAGLEGSAVSLTIYDVAGRRVASILEDKVVAAGRQSLTWNGVSESGQRVSGVFFAELRTAQGVQRQRVTIAK